MIAVTNDRRPRSPLPTQRAGDLKSLDGDEKKVNDAMRPDPPTFTHPALELFRGIPVGGLNESRFYRWWKVSLPGKNAPGVVVGTMRNPTTRTPLVVERSYAAALAHGYRWHEFGDTHLLLP